VEAEAYWRDVGTIDAYWEANIDLTDVTPSSTSTTRDWPIWTYAEDTPPAKFVHDEDGPPRHGRVLAGVRRLHRLGRRAARSCCSPACARNSYSTRRGGDAAALPMIGRNARG
jgi:glucose-1-phosphate adenylyltransferase